jgi:hypothetical protein
MAKIRSLLLLAAAMLLLTSCRIVVNTAVNADGSGELRTSVVYSAQEKEAFEEKPENESKGICDDLKKDVPAGATFNEELTDSGETFCTTNRPFRNLAELRTFYAGMSQVTVNRLDFEFGKFVLDVEVDLSEDEDGASLEHEWGLTLPGEIGTNNADRVAGQTLFWVVSPGEKASLHAESQAGLNPATVGITGTMIAVLILALVAAVGVIGFLLGRRKA